MTFSRQPSSRHGSQTLWRGLPREGLMDAARAALRWFERFDAHAPSDMHFGGEAAVRRGLREALRIAELPTAPDPQDYETSEAFEAAEACYEEELRSGPMGQAERESFERGFLEARAEPRRW